MGELSKLPFKDGHLVEERSFVVGYRGAWFRSKIIGGIKNRGQDAYILQYYDYPDQKPIVSRIYKVEGKGKEKRRELMIRPCYPPIYDEKKIPDAGMISEVAVVIEDSWKVGDLVDWFQDGCYWSGRIIQLLGDDKAMIKLNPPPHGEGSTYEAHFKDIRPSLNWSLKSGWTVPTQSGGDGRSCARLIKPINQGQEHGSDQVTAGPSTGPSFSSRVAVLDEFKGTATAETETKKQTSLGTVPKESNYAQEKSTSLGHGADADSVQTTAKTTTEVAERDHNHEGRGGMDLRSSRSDKLEAAILDLEEYLNQVKWLKWSLQYGISPSHAPKPQWESQGPK